MFFKYSSEFFYIFYAEIVQIDQNISIQELQQSISNRNKNMENLGRNHKSTWYYR